MANKLSFSKISAYSICGERYRLRYEAGYQEKFSRASLLFGSAIDDALNTLLETRDLMKAEAAFDKKWNFQYIKGEYTALQNNVDIVYANSDFDEDLVTATPGELETYYRIAEQKKIKGWEELDLKDRQFFNLMNWYSLSAKGRIILKSYNEKVLPLFIEVKGIQHKTELVNNDGDSVVQVLDFVATLQDGSVVLFDNKTTSNLTYYDDDAPGTSQQLVSYFFNNKEEFGLGAVGFIAIQKAISKNKTKTCKLCGTTAEEGSRVKTCAVEREPGVKKSRCNGEFSIEMDPEAAIKVIVNPVTDAAINLVLSTFDEANQGIKNKNWYKNLNTCKNIYGSPCEFYSLCWKGETSDLVKIEKKNA